MQHPGFFERAGPFPLSALIEIAGAVPHGEFDPQTEIKDVKPLDVAGRGDISFLDNRKYLPLFQQTSAAACLVSPKFAGKAPLAMAALVTGDPYRAFAKVLAAFYPDALKPKAAMARGANAPNIHPTAQLEEGAVVEPGAIIGAEAAIGRGTTIAAGTVIGYRVYVGRDCYIGPNANLTHTLVGDRVIIHASVSIGQDGFGFALGKGGHEKVPQIGRVVVQNDVEIGANTTIDRGALRDTVIGEGSKIDNLVQIGHNVVIGRHCVIVAQTGISGSAQLDDYVILGGQVGVVGHVKIGAGAQIAGSSNVRGDVPPGARWGGTPAKPVRLWFRELTLLRRLAEREDRKIGDNGGGDEGKSPRETDDE